MKIALTVNGLHVEAHYHDDEIEKVHKPLLQQLAKIHAAKPERRTIVFLSAPPGTGKSTLTTFWEYLSRQDAGLPEIQTPPMDGFHYYNRWLEAHHLRACKGVPETFDVDKLAENLRLVRAGEATWPQYDRQRHDPVAADVSRLKASSRTNSLGCMASALAITTRCVSPPESVPGWRWRNDWQFVRVSASSMRRRISASWRPRFSGPNATSSSTLKVQPESCKYGDCCTN